MASKLDEFMAEIKAFDYKWFDEIGGNEALTEIDRLREQASGTTQAAPDAAYAACPYRSRVNHPAIGEVVECEFAAQVS